MYISSNDIINTEPRLLVIDAEPRLLFSEKTSPSRDNSLTKQA